MNEIINKDTKIENLIYEIKGVQVMLDSDIAYLYNVNTKRINEAVNRNKEKFPERYSFILSDFEKNILWSQNATANRMARINLHVFIEEGVAMLSSVLKTNIACECYRKKVNNE